MKFFSALLVAILVLTPLKANAQLLTLGVSNTTTGGGGGYVGPADAYGSTPVVWGGVRAMNATYATSLGNAVEICTAADALCTILHVTSAGALNSSDLTASGCSAIVTCTVKTVYDQTGGGHNWVQATIGSRPTFDPNGVSSGKPSLKVGASSSSNMAASGITSTATPYTFAVISMQNGTPGGYVRVFTGNDPIGILYSSSDNFAFDAGSPTNSNVTSTHGTYYAVTGRTDGSGSGGAMLVSGTPTTGLASGSTATGTTSIVFYSGGNLDSAVTEFGWWNTNNSTNAAALNSNMQTWCGC